MEKKEKNVFRKKEGLRLVFEECLSLFTNDDTQFQELHIGFFEVTESTINIVNVLHNGDDSTFFDWRQIDS